MRRITKQQPPHELRTWFIGQPENENGERINSTYEDMPGEVRVQVKQGLLQEQGHLCCYTGIRITDERSHIEHLKPQSMCEDHEDIDYNNLLAAYPGIHQPRSPFGAHAKDNWYDENLLVSPLDDSCERRFRFTQFGKVKPVNENDTAASETIRRLGLDHDSLNDMRRQAIAEALYRKNKPLSEKQLESLIDRYCEADAHSNQMRPFCFVIQQAAQDFLDRLKKKREKKKYRKKPK
jgi:uncharacterized protein (TIGR02646 family)